MTRVPGRDEFAEVVTLAVVDELGHVIDAQDISPVSEGAHILEAQLNRSSILHRRAARVMI